MKIRKKMYLITNYHYIKYYFIKISADVRARLENPRHSNILYPNKICPCTVQETGNLQFPNDRLTGRFID